MKTLRKTRNSREKTQNSRKNSKLKEKLKTQGKNSKLKKKLKELEVRPSFQCQSDVKK